MADWPGLTKKELYLCGRCQATKRARQLNDEGLAIIASQNHRQSRWHEEGPLEKVLGLLVVYRRRTISPFPATLDFLRVLDVLANQRLIQSDGIHTRTA